MMLSNMSLRVNAERLKSRLETLARIGYQEGEGITRLAYGPEDVKARAYVGDLLREAGLTVRYDPAWNLIARWEPAGQVEPGDRDQPGGQNERGDDNGRSSELRSSGSGLSGRSLPVVVMGSHLDTVPHGGPFDGALGVMAAVEVAQTLSENGWPIKRPLEVIAFANEEGTIGGGTFGSQAMAGLLGPEELIWLEDEGSALARAYRSLGLNPKQVPSARRPAGFAAAYLELHIEQGAVLERAGVPIGIVQGIVGINRYKITLWGRAGHAGATPMTERDDALVRAARFILEINERASSYGLGTVATIGRLEASPGVFNVIPGRVELYAETRSLKEEILEELESFLKKEVGSAGSLEVVLKKPPVAMDQSIMEHIATACNALGVGYQFMPSGAGHDAMNMAFLAPTGMIFVPSRDGRSHVPEEWTDWEYVTLGAQVLLETCLRVADR